MKVVDTDLAGGIVRVAFSGDGRLLAAVGSNHHLTVWDWANAAMTHRMVGLVLSQQLSFSTDGNWLACVAPSLSVIRITPGPSIGPPIEGRFDWGGGIAFSPDGKFLVASQYGTDRQLATPGKLVRWSTKTWAAEPGFDHWPPFHRLAFGRNGEFLAGINAERFELRFAISGGLNGWGRPGATRRGTHTHLSFSPTGSAVAFGWNDELHVMDANSGRVAKTLYDPESPFRDAAFAADGRRLGTVSDDGTVKLWDAATWGPAERYDWGCGPLRCLAFSPDGACGACGTAGGQLIFFDVDG